MPLSVPRNISDIFLQGLNWGSDLLFRIIDRPFPAHRAQRHRVNRPSAPSNSAHRCRSFVQQPNLNNIEFLRGFWPEVHTDRSQLPKLRSVAVDLPRFRTSANLGSYFMPHMLEGQHEKHRSRNAQRTNGFHHIGCRGTMPPMPRPWKLVQQP